MIRTDTPARARHTRPTQPVKQPTASILKACSCVIPESTPRYTSFNHIRDPKVRRAKDYEQHLLFMRDSFPEYTAGIDEQIAYARSQQERNRVSDRDRVLKQLEPCELSCSEVADDLMMPYATTYKILKALAECGLVAIRQRPGRAGNKPVCYYSLTHSL
jgi:DNA-binding transcriptional ArsR family regulator